MSNSLWQVDFLKTDWPLKSYQPVTVLVMGHSHYHKLTFCRFWPHKKPTYTGDLRYYSQRLYLETGLFICLSTGYILVIWLETVKPLPYYPLNEILSMLRILGHFSWCTETSFSPAAALSKVSSLFFCGAWLAKFFIQRFRKLFPEVIIGFDLVKKRK